jgi:Fe-S cluster biosynthesis and repair protein YggX
MTTATERAEQIARYRNMVAGDPDDDLAHFRLGQALMEDEQYPEAVKAFERTLELSPGFSRVFQFLGECLIKAGDKAKAVEVLTNGWKTASERGDRVPMEAMGKLLTSLGAPIPEPVVPKIVDEGPGTGFRCQRPGCMEGKRARQLPAPPMPDEIGQQIYDNICMACWNLWFRDLSVKLINENRLDLSSEHSQKEYDHHMRDFMGFEEEAAH